MMLAEIPICLDPFACTLALIAIFYAIWEARKNNVIILKMKEFSFSGVQSVDENDGEKFVCLRVVILNKGMTLHNVKLFLSYTHFSGLGRVSVPVPINETIYNKGDFARGMLAEFVIKSYKYKNCDMLLETLNNVEKQNVTLCLYSQNYLAKEFRFDNFFKDVERKLKKMPNYKFFKLHLGNFRKESLQLFIDVLKRERDLP